MGVQLAKSKIPPLDGEFEDNSDSESERSSADEDEDEDIESESECETDTDENKLRELQDLHESSYNDKLIEAILYRDEYKIDSMGNECLPDYIWDKLSKL
jgi:hypothetical protein